MHNFSIKAKLIIAALLISLVPLIVLGLINLNRTTDVLSKSVEDALTTIVHSKDFALESYISNTQKTAQSFADTEIMQEYIAYLYKDLNEEEIVKFGNTEAQVNDILYNYMEQHWGIEYHHIFIADAAGEIILSPDHKTNTNNFLLSHLNSNISDNPWFKPALEHVQVTDYSTWVESDHYHQLLLLPVKDADNITKAVIGFELMIDHEHKILSDGFKLGETGEVFLATLNGEPVVHLKNEEQAELNTKGIEEAKKDGFFVGRSINKNGIEVIGFYLKNDKFPWILVAEIETREAFESVALIQTYFYIGLALTTLLVILLALILSSLITKPIVALSSTAQDIVDGNINKRIHLKSKDEIGQLAVNFNQMTDNLVEAKKRVEIVLESMGDGIFEIDSNYKLIMYNDMASRLTGYSKKEALGEKYSKILNFVYEADGKINDKPIKKCLESGKIVSSSSHTLLVRRDDMSIPIDYNVAPIKDKGGKTIACVVVFRDISIARKVDKMKSEFVSIASHQLRTPLTSIKLFVNMLANDDTENFNTNQLEYIKSIQISSDRMVGLVNDLLNVSRLEGGQIMIDPKPTSLFDFISDLVKESTPFAREKGCKIKYNKPTRKSDKIQLDPTLLRQVINNVLTNAIIYSPPGHGKIEFGLEKKDNNYVISIKDNGIGIPKDVQPKIFGKFFRSANAIKTVGDGSGLGLYLAKMIMDSSGGKIWFASKADQGTTFYVSIPEKGMKKSKGGKRLS